MGCFFSYTVPFSVEELDIYQELCGLTRAEIIHAYKKFHNIDPMSFAYDKKGSISFISVAETLPELAVNPFRYRICKVFCSSEEGYMDFDDFLDLVSIMNRRTPIATKLAWAFKIYDFNEDDAICPEDLDKVLDHLTGNYMSQRAKDMMIQHILNETDVDGDGAMSFQEFERVMTFKAGPDFLENFRFTL